MVQAAPLTTDIETLNEANDVLAELVAELGERPDKDLIVKALEARIDAIRVRPFSALCSRPALHLRERALVFLQRLIIADSADSAVLHRPCVLNEMSAVLKEQHAHKDACEQDALDHDALSLIVQLVRVEGPATWVDLGMLLQDYRGSVFSSAGPTATITRRCVIVADHALALFEDGSLYEMLATGCGDHAPLPGELWTDETFREWPTWTEARYAYTGGHDEKFAPTPAAQPIDVEALAMKFFDTVGAVHKVGENFKMVRAVMAQAHTPEGKQQFESVVGLAVTSAVGWLGRVTAARGEVAKGDGA